MKTVSSKVSFKHLYKHETKKRVLFKFLSVLLVLVGYLLFVSYKYGIEQGFLVTMVTWSFFVLSTPIADAGFLIDFPMRFILKVKMVYSEVLVWVIAISLNIYVFFLRPEVYDATPLLVIFKKIISTPFPFWGIILISALGTFLSVHFGDELINTIKHKERREYKKHKYNYRLIFMVFIFAMSFILYTLFAKQLGIENLF